MIGKRNDAAVGECSFSNTEVVPDKEIPVLDRVSVPPDNNVVPSGVVNDVSF